MKKKVFLLLTVSSVLMFSCTDNSTELIEERKEINETIINQNSELDQIDPIKDCPQNDRNCNGIPDSQE
ncbi:hypothetical protein [uncultured Tenacibaculum sp.]|uniref:hypothetical protein n=1 Tax=uncultured Tenacibaculum sp. TaxID=174713 RepID=UPI00262C86A6|nr:hypothetical protein [uncultured Tenacibaculum sp.]